MSKKLLAMRVLLGEGSAENGQALCALAQASEPDGKGMVVQWLYRRSVRTDASPVHVASPFVHGQMITGAEPARARPHPECPHVQQDEANLTLMQGCEEATFAGREREVVHATVRGEGAPQGRTLRRSRG